MNKSLFVFVAALFLGFSFNAHANKAAFKKIAKLAQVANGSTTVGKYDTSLGKAQLVARGLKELKSERWENCGPWTEIKSRRTAIKKISEIEGVGEPEGAEKILQKLYDADEIAAIVGTESNNEIECSLAWFNVYGVDGSVLELRYNMGD
jgi:hypothetical protein